ncbi:uncharacterized protein LOC125036909 [Penaeus chinensis]|uniref:uncharacterized protein LOC125036909 n=1 Tax=Penaeus chinensis TaxID=139456 RepID=UPI001FB5E121|nr:uncharacterized protein LOC125036909 [Penaeus chinensis]XP_047485813.1 uncharacterized protein LOC125036909 [Penaeus chinensis]XP_047485814.1 uncharacterized protein LOC125036909 [Penaeus chinensis]
MGLITINTGYLRTKSGILKIIEIVCVASAVGLLRVSSPVCGQTVGSYFLGVGVLVAALMVTPLLLISYMMGKMQIQNTFLEIAFNALFALLLLTVGVDALKAVGNVYRDDYNKKCFAMGIVSIAACITYLLDTVVCVRLYRNNN